MQAPDLRGTIEGILSCDPYLTEFEEVESSVAEVPEVDAARLLALCGNALRRADTAAVESIRVSCAKVLVALLPHSSDAIQSLLSGKDDHLYEVHFSLFCFLDWVPSCERLAPSASFVLSITTSYLREVTTDEAQAAWMAGDMIGDHWPNVDDATDALIDVLDASRFRAGKEGALHGVSQLLRRNGLGAERSARLVSSLKRIACVEPESELAQIASRLAVEFDVARND